MVVRMRHTRSQTGQRRSHHRLKTQARANCAQCGAIVRRHLACSECGWYRGRLVVTKKAKPASTEKKKKQ